MMEEITYDKALKEELKNVETYFLQLGNIFCAICRLLYISLQVTISITSGVALISLTMIEFNSLNDLTQYQEFIKFMLTYFSLISIILSIVINAGKFRNIFSERASDRVYRFNKIKEDFEKEMNNIDNALLTYGLITENDINSRKEKIEKIIE